MDAMQGLTVAPERIGNYGYDKPWTAGQLGMVALFVVMFVTILGPALWGLMVERMAPDDTANEDYP